MCKKEQVSDKNNPDKRDIRRGNKLQKKIWKKELYGILKSHIDRFLRIYLNFPLLNVNELLSRLNQKFQSLKD